MRVLQKYIFQTHRAPSSITHHFHQVLFHKFERLTPAAMDIEMKLVHQQIFNPSRYFILLIQLSFYMKIPHDTTVYWSLRKFMHSGKGIIIVCMSVF